MSPSKKPATSPDLRQRIYTNIDKLSDRATLSAGASSLKLIAQNLEPSSLPTFLSCILSVDSSSKSPVRVHCLNLLPLLAQTHNSSLSPHLPKITASLLRRLRDSDSAVRAACISVAGALSPLGFSALSAPLIAAVLSEQDVNPQIGSCLCLKAAVDSSGGGISGGDESELRRVLPKMLKLVKGEGFKAKAALLGAVGSFVSVSEGRVVNGGLVGNVVVCAVEMLTSEDWAARKAAAEVLHTVALGVETHSLMEFKRFCVTSLDSRRFDKVKITRESMNRALEAWREVGSGPDDDLLSTTSSISRGGVSSPCISRRSSFAGIETPKPKKTMTKARSSLSDALSSCTSPSMSSNTSDIIGLETRQRKKTISKSRSSLSDDSTITDSSSVSKSSHDVCFETLQSKTKRTSISKSKPRTSKVQIATPTITYAKAKSDDDDDEAQSECKTVESSSVEVRVQNFGGLRYGSQVVPYIEEYEAERMGFGVEANAEVGENNADVEDISLIRKQLLQIEKQQSNLLDLLQRFMGNSQNGIDSLETRVNGLERALDEISYDLAIQSGRIPKNDSGGSTCTEFLSPKFWRKTEGRSSSYLKSTYSGEAFSMDGYRLKEQNEGGIISKNTSQSGHRGRTCSPRSIDVASTATFMTSVVRGA